MTMDPLSGRPSFGQEDLSLPQRLLHVLIAPRRSFEAVVGRESAHDWLLPVLLVCLVGWAAHFLTVEVITDLDSPQVQQTLEKLDETGRERYLEGLETIRTHGWVAVPVGTFFSLVVVGGVLFYLTRTFFYSEVTFRQMLMVKAYAGMVLVPEWILRTLMVRATGRGDVQTGPGAFMGPVAPEDLLGRVLAGIDFFDLWQIFLMAVGVSVVARCSARRTGAAILGLWLLWLGGLALLETLGGRSAPG